jgi:cadmium resistance protein CadD (predicted permease)
MSAVASTVLLAVGAFVGTNLDNLLALSGQLAATDRSRHRRIIDGQVAATVVLLALSALAGVAFAMVPGRLLGLLGLVPIALGVRAGVLLVRRRPDDRSMPAAAGLVTSFLVTLAIGADNVAVYLPVLATGTVAAAIACLAIWLALDLVLVALAAWLGRHPATERVVGRIGPVALPVLYVIIGVVVLLRAGTLTG